MTKIVTIFVILLLVCHKNSRMKSESNEITASPKSLVISAVIDVEVLDFSVIFSVCTEFLPFPENGEGAKEVNLWMPALRTCIPYGHLGNSWRTSFHSAGLSHPSTL